MGKKSRTKQQKTVNVQPQQTEEAMSTNQEVEVVGSTQSSTNNGGNMTDAAQATLNEASQPKPTETSKPADKPAEPRGVVDIVTDIPSMVWNKVLKPSFDFGKDLVTRGWKALVDFYEAEVAAFKEMGAGNYLMHRATGLGIKLFKVLIVATVVSFIANLIFSVSGINIFDPFTLAIIAVVTLIGLVGSSYLAQKKAGQDFSIGTTATHITDQLIAA